MLLKYAREVLAQIKPISSWVVFEALRRPLGGVAHNTHSLWPFSLVGKKVVGLVGER